MNIPILSDVVATVANAGVAVVVKVAETLATVVTTIL